MPGTGLGLAIAKEIVEAHRGHDPVRQRPRRGDDVHAPSPDGGASPPAHRPASRRRARGGVVRRSPPAVLALVALLVGSGCLPTRNAPQPAEPTAQSEWPAVYARAIADANESRTSEADRGLSAFALRFPGSAEASEVTYWRALLKLDPNNAAAIRESVTMLDSYLASAPVGRAPRRGGGAAAARCGARAAQCRPRGDSAGAGGASRGQGARRRDRAAARRAEQGERGAGAHPPARSRGRAPRLSRRERARASARSARPARDGSVRSPPTRARDRRRAAGPPRRAPSR